MAKQGKPSKERSYTDVDAKTGLGTLTVQVDKEKKTSTVVKNVASTAASFKSLIASADENALSSLFSIYTRGIESAARVAFKSRHNTLVSLGGKNKIDLLEFAESTNPKFGIKNAILMIQGRFDTLALLAASGEEKPEDAAKNAAALRKREAGWYNTAEALVQSGKAKYDNGRLVVA